MLTGDCFILSMNTVDYFEQYYLIMYSITILVSFNCNMIIILKLSILVPRFNNEKEWMIFRKKRAARRFTIGKSYCFPNFYILIRQSNS